jgi:glycosyltransferase involved in cell wall biosynthesis
VETPIPLMRQASEGNTIYRIGLDARPLSTRVSGVGRLIAETIRHFPEKENYQFALFSHLPIHESHKTILQLPNVEFHQGKGLLSKKGATYFNLSLPLSLNQFHLDLFWGSQQVIPPLFFSKLPIVLTYCDLVLYKYPETMRLLAAIQQRLVQGYSVRKSDFILSISEQTRVDLVKHFNYPENKTGVAYPGVDVKEAINSSLKTPSDRVKNLQKPYLLSVSTIEPRKNYPFLLEAFKEYRKLTTNSRLHWVIAGKVGWEKESFLSELKNEMAEYNDIILLDNVDDIDLHNLYKGCEIFLFASVYEGFGIPLLEALAHKRKCIVSDIPTFREIGKDKIPYLKTENPKLWAEEINKLEKSNIIPKINLDFFSWENSARITKNVFDSLLQKI